MAIFLTIPVTGCAPHGHRLNDNIVERDQLASQLQTRTAAKKMVVLDVRDEADYAAGHVAGAIRLDAKQWKADSLTAGTGLTQIAFWRQRIGNLGISGDTPVIVYGNGQMTEASRVWFILQHFGVRDVRVVDGGYPALKSAVDSDAIALSTTPATPTPVRFVPDESRDPAVGMANRREIMSSLDNARVQILDTRTPGEYAGADLRGNPRGGHIPHAINLPHKDFLNADGTLKSPEQLRKIFREAGFRKGTPIITHCQSGGRASLAALAAERAGYKHVINYYQSFSDWAADSSCPISKPRATGDTHDAAMPKSDD